MTSVFTDKSLSHLRSAHRNAKPRAARRRASLGAIALVAVIAVPAAAQPDPGLVARLDSVAGSLVAEKRAVGTVAAVVQGNDTLLLEAYGKADVEWDVPMSLDAVFEIGSATKQFTAVALLKLRDQGVLRLDDEITRWLPDFDTRDNTVTLRQLLGHTSGLPDFTEMPDSRELMTNRFLPRDTAYELLQSHPFLFKPGEMQIYNNSGLWLLGLVIEKASGC
jgi:CubicO group peptidase (beta-lactamase class C family)